MTLGPETPFKFAFIALFVAVAAIATAVARRAARAHGAAVNQLHNEARGLIVIRAALGLVFYAMLAVWLFRTTPPAWTRLPMPGIARWTAVALLLPGIAIFAWSFASLGSEYRGGVGLYDNHRLVTTGAYRFVRHPIYLSFIVVMALGAAVSANWVLATSGLALVGLIAMIRIPIEERELGERFANRWDHYKVSTGALFPRILR